jgi:hypothetical protein
MDPEVKDAPEVLETPVPETTEEKPAVEEAPAEPQTDAEKEALRKENEELKKKNSQLFERVKKAKETTDKDGLTVLDGLALQKEGIDHDEDIQEAVDYAAYKKITVRDALKHDALKSIIKDKVEVRRSALAAQTRSPRGTQTVSHETVLQRAREGNVKETDIEKLTEARMAERLAASKR